jgi:hypothetical protein
MIRPYFVLAAASLGLAACAAQTPRTRADAATNAACEQRADEVYLKQNRADLYRSDVYNSSTRDAPFASTGLTGITSAGLPQRYARDTMLSDCIRQSSTDVQTGPEPGQGPATAPAPAAAAAPSRPR